VGSRADLQVAPELTEYNLKIRTPQVAVKEEPICDSSKRRVYNESRESKAISAGLPRQDVVYSEREPQTVKTEETGEAKVTIIISHISHITRHAR
jgi:hypothetical protein